ncbi:peptidylprolyl isomerase [Bathymodiolus azoricus thioautotrophic gill symbiont]|uniref:peptidylprolyl isomerase n=3 Tax=sulfur-oxidizing symbionts TaxID=32036 RepID=A0A1H6M0P7_9GAMM|nr:peptidylprolyl isomerase [Bathymodiolus azoricus thioautotrophic gill symbiont]
MYFTVILGIIPTFVSSLNLMKTLIVLFTLFLSLQSQAKLAEGLYANLHTNQGDIVVQLAYKKAPLTVINFVGLAEGTKRSNIQTGKPFYNGLKFHRVIDNFMIQGGDPKGNGAGGPGYRFADEFSNLKHDKAGILSMANSGPDTNGSQFFITHNATPGLDGKHAVFGHVVKGMSVVNRIKKGDFIRKLTIIRVGDEAKKFQTDEVAFQVENKKHAIKKNEKFVKSNYPNAKATDGGYFVQITQKGTGAKSSKGDMVNVKISSELDGGKKTGKTDEIITFALGENAMAKIIDQTVLGMKVGEKRTIITNNIVGISKISLLIINLELLSINQ